MKERKGILLLLLCSLIWGFTFAFQSMAAATIPPFAYNGTRMLLGALVLLPLLVKILRGKDRSYFRSLLLHGSALGLLIGTASMLQQIGIGYTTAGKAGFITSLYMLFVPVISVFLGKKVRGRIWLCVLGGLTGAYMLSTGVTGKIGKGDILILLCAICFALHIIYVDRFGGAFNGVDLSAIQFLTAGAVELLLSFVFEKPSLSSFSAAIIPILYAGIFSCGVAYTLQIVGQKSVEPVKATLALSLESVWSAVGGALLLGERLSGVESAGCIILFVSVLVAELPAKEN